MIQGLAIWHYPHRTMAENIRFFATRGFESVSLHGAQFVAAIADPVAAEDIATAVRETGVLLTLHYCLPRSHEADAVAVFSAGIKAIEAWQKRYGHIRILSFDVPQPVRGGKGIREYLEMALDTVPSCRVAVEDFGLNEVERAQIKSLRGNERFGYLVDIGHLFIRLRGQNTSGKTLFTHTPDEHERVEDPDAAVFQKVLMSKDYPIFEMHLHNNDGVDDLHWFLEQGSMDVPAVAEALRACGFDGVLTVESAPGYKFECRGREADEGILKTFAYWKNCCNS